MMDDLIEQKNYFIAIFTVALIGAVALVFKPDSQAIHVGIFWFLFLTTIAIVLLSVTIGALVLSLSWILTRKFSLRRFVNIAATVCILWTMVSIVSTILEVVKK